MDQQHSFKDTLQNITNSDDLEIAIRLMEERKEKQEKELYEVYRRFQSGLTPQSLLRSAVLGIKTSPPLRKDLFRIALGLGAGYLSKNIIVSRGGSVPKKILGDILQYGIATLVTAVPAGAAHKRSVIGKVGILLKKLLTKSPQA